MSHLPGCGDCWHSPFVDGIHIGSSQSCQHGASDDAIVHALWLSFLEDQLGQFTHALYSTTEK